MKTLVELSGNRIAVLNYYLQSLAASLHDKKYDDLIPCNYRVESVIVIDYKSGDRFGLMPGDVMKIADEINTTAAIKKNVPLSELV